MCAFQDVGLWWPILDFELILSSVDQMYQGDHGPCGQDDWPEEPCWLKWPKRPSWPEKWSEWWTVATCRCSPDKQPRISAHPVLCSSCHFTALHWPICTVYFTAVQYIFQTSALCTVYFTVVQYIFQTSAVLCAHPWATKCSRASPQKTKRVHLAPHKGLLYTSVYFMKTEQFSEEQSRAVQCVIEA